MFSFFIWFADVLNDLGDLISPITEGTDLIAEG